MSMYLPNPDVGPIGAEPCEFIDFPPTAEELGTRDREGRPGRSPDSTSRAVARDAVARKQPTEKDTTVFESPHVPRPRLRLLVATTAVVVAALALAALGRAGANGSSAPSVKPTIVLVHGAWADGSSWNDVSDRLQAAGFEVRVPPNNLRGVRSDAAHLASHLGTITGPIVLVAHSYGGVIITNAATGNDQIRALVYVDALIPAEGETLVDMTHPPSVFAQDPANVFDVVPGPDAPSGVVDMYVKPSVYAAGFTNEGFSRRQISVLAASQRPLSSQAFEEPSGPPAWESIPSWAIVGEADRIIPVADQVAMARNAGSLVVRIDAPHLSTLTDPRAITDVIIRAARTR